MMLEELSWGKNVAGLVFLGWQHGELTNPLEKLMELTDCFELGRALYAESKTGLF